MSDHSPLTRKLVADGIRGPTPQRAFTDYPLELQAAVNAYDAARRTAFGRTGESAMSDTNKASIAPMIAAAVAAYVEATRRAA